MKAVVPRLICTVGSLGESLKHSRLIHHRGGTQAPEGSEAHHGILTHRHVWEPLGSGIELLAAQGDEYRAHRRQCGSVLGDSPNAVRALDSRSL